MFNNQQPWYLINEIDQLDSPGLVIYAERVKENIQKLIDGIDDLARLRPHVKTHKSSEVTKLLLAAGINKFKCATIAEAEMLGLCNCKDVLLAYQPCGPKLERFVALMEKYPDTQFSCLVDNLSVAQQISAIALQHNLTISVYVDVNVGMNRTGIEPDDTIELCESISKLPNIQLVGLHAYDGHNEDIDMVKRTAASMEIYKSMTGLKETLLKKGFGNITLVMGGSPSFPIYSQLKDVECSPGTFVYWDQNYQNGLPEQDFQPAALVIGRIISLPSTRTITVDIGHKSVSSEYDLTHRIRFLNAPDLKPIGHSEEHLVMEAPENHHYQIGDVLYGLPYHICPTCALYEFATIVEDHSITTTWKIIARDRKITV